MRDDAPADMAPILSFRELRVYVSAFETAVEILEMSKGFPAHERHGLVDQLRRSATSVCANLAEAWRRRRSARHFVSKLSDADAEAAEVAVWLDFALRLGYLTPEAHATYIDRYDHIGRQLTLMIRSPEQWVRPDP